MLVTLSVLSRLPALIEVLVPGWRNVPEYVGEGCVSVDVVTFNLFSAASDRGVETGEENGENVELEP